MKYAVKLLSSSDLTLFAAYFRLHGSSKQKGINLNGDVLSDQLFPALPAQIVGTFEQPVTLDIYGPGGAPLARQDRKINKAPGGKNWRLNGKLIDAPRAEPDRYSFLAPGDVAILGFDGEPLPLSLNLLLLSQSSAEDAPLLERLRADLGLVVRSRSMVALTEQQVASFCADLAMEHPLRLFLPDQSRTQDLSGAAAGDDDAAERLYRRAKLGRTRPVSAAELERARIRAQEIGRAGEILLNRHLEGELAEGSVDEFEWSSNTNAVSPFDFVVFAGPGQMEYQEVKTTSGKFDQPFHISIAELQLAAADVPFRIARIYGVENVEGARMRLSAPITALAMEVCAALVSLPPGVSVSSVQIDTGRLTWSDEIILPTADPDEEDD